MKNDEKNNTPSRWLSPTDLFEEYGFSKSAQSKMRMKRSIPFSKVGNKILYCRFSIDTWLEANRVNTIA